VAVAKVTPPAAAAPAAAAAAPQITQAKPAAPSAEKKPVDKKVAAVAPTPAAAAPAARPSGAGYVAVLSSVPASSSSRMEALKQFADMQQKYGSVLQSKTPDVTEANLGAKGTFHRLVVGPPGSREQASALCGQLKTAGYGGCWVTAY
jgi:cell division septation protein DedD